MLDERIVPSAIAIAPKPSAALVEHVPAPHAVHVAHAIVHHAPKHHPKVLVTTPVSNGTTPPAANSAVIAIPVTGGQTSTTASPSAPVVAAPVPSGLTTPKDGPLAKAGQDLNTIYQEFEQQGGSATFTSSLAGVVEIQGTKVGVDVHMAGGDFGTFVTTMTNLGMQVQTTDATDGIVEGLLPIAQIPAVAQNSQTLSLSPIYTPKLSMVRL